MMNLYDINPLPFLENVSFPNVLPNIWEKASLLPIILVQNRAGKFFLVDGYKRFNFLKKEKIASFLFTVSKKNVDEKREELFLDYLKFNFGRGLNDIEISNMIYEANHYFQNSKLLNDIFDILNLKISPENITKFKNIFGLSELCKYAYVDNFLNKSVAVELSLLTSDQQDIVLKLFKHLRLNGNKQKKTFNMLLDMCKRNSLNISSILEKYFNGIFESPFSKALEENFFDTLLEIHSPNYYKFKKNFSKFKSLAVGREKGVNILSPSNFEDTNYKMEIFFKDLREMEIKTRHIIENMELLKEKDEFKELFE